jgi:hypothetical protein
MEANGTEGTAKNAKGAEKCRRRNPELRVVKV